MRIRDFFIVYKDIFLPPPLSIVSFITIFSFCNDQFHLMKSNQIYHHKDPPGAAIVVGLLYAKQNIMNCFIEYIHLK